MTWQNFKGLAGADMRLSAIRCLNAHPSGDDVSDVRVGCFPCLAAGMLRPFPAGAVAAKTDRCRAKIDGRSPAAIQKRPGFVARHECFDNWIHPSLPKLKIDEAKQSISISCAAGYLETAGANEIPLAARERPWIVRPDCANCYHRFTTRSVLNGELEGSLGN